MFETNTQHNLHTSGHKISLKSKKLVLFVHKHHTSYNLKSNLLQLHTFVFVEFLIFLFLNVLQVLDHLLLIFNTRVHASCSYLIG